MGGYWSAVTSSEHSLADEPQESSLGGFPEAQTIEPGVGDEAVTPEPAKTDHPTGEDQADENAENEPAG
jgi:hypothetical protein